MSAILTGSATARFQWAALKGALKLEKLGMKHSSGRSVRAHVIRLGKFPPGTSHEDLIAFCEKQMEDFS